MSSQSHIFYEFEDFRLDLAEKVLVRNGSIIPLTPKVFKTLQIFVENPGHLIEKEELMQRLWKDRFVEDSNLTFNIKMLRKALGDDAARPRFIETVPKRGYRFVSSVRRHEKEHEPAAFSAELPATLFPPRSPTSGGRPSGANMGAVVALAEWREKDVRNRPDDLLDDLPAETNDQKQFSKLSLAAPLVKRRGSPYLYLFAGLISLLVLAGVGYWYVGNWAASKTPRQSIAVLPFQNLSGDSNLDYLSDGLSESIIDRLSELAQLKVIARNSSFRFRGQDDWQQAASALGVGAIVTGRIMLQGDGLTVRVELVDVNDNRQLWSQTYTCNAAEVPAIREEITRTISEKLRLRLSGEQERQFAKRKEVNPQAFELLLKGRFHSLKGGAENWKQAVEFYQQAITADPNYAPAYTGLFWTYRNLITRGVLNPKEFVPVAVKTAYKALELDPDTGETHLAMAYITRDAWKWQQAEASYKRALELNPNLASGHGSYSAYLSVVGRHDEAVAEAKLARALDPFSPLFSVNSGFILFLARRYDEALETMKEALELDRNNSNAHLILGLIYLEKGMYHEAIAEHQEAVRVDKVSPNLLISLGTAYARAGDREQAQIILRQMQESGAYIPPPDLAIFHAALGDHEEAFASLEKPVAAHDIQMQYLGVGPAYDSLRPDPRFQDLLRRVGLAK